MHHVPAVGVDIGPVESSVYELKEDWDLQKGHFTTLASSCQFVSSLPYVWCFR